MPYAVSHCQLHRVFRVGACPVLEITVTHPRLNPDPAGSADLPPAACRFNRAYEQVAEGILRWCEGAPREAAEEAFRRAGDGAAYRFDRRVVVCEMMAAYTESGRVGGAGTICVTRTLRMGSRRGETGLFTRLETDRWELPALTLGGLRKKSPPISKK